MTIGFFDTRIESLLFFKEMVKAYPNNDFYYYADTGSSERNSTEEEQMVRMAHTAFEYFKQKGVTCICLAPEIPFDLFERTIGDQRSSITLITFGAFEDYAQEQKLYESVGEEKTRSIHLTKHSAEQDMFIEKALGGLFVHN